MYRLFRNYMKSSSYISRYAVFSVLWRTTFALLSLCVYDNDCDDDLDNHKF
jgi:hypothetical protein